MKTLRGENSSRVLNTNISSALDKVAKLILNLMFDYSDFRSHVHELGLRYCYTFVMVSFIRGLPGFGVLWNNMRMHKGHKLTVYNAFILLLSGLHFLHLSLVF